tara:strand:- start:1083 stop:2393 length:1311 start_codon:yes stop_codon:yes gene_type:complete
LKKNRKVYIGMSADIIHHGHLNIINEGAKHGEVIIGLLTDEAIVSYKSLPLMTFAERKKIVESIKGVSKVMPQNTLDYTFNLKKIKPDYVVHGDDWKEGVQRETRAKVIETLKEWDGTLIEPKYTSSISSSMLKNSFSSKGISTNDRVKSLRRLLQIKPFVRILEAHSGLTALIAENTQFRDKGKIKEFDGIWESSLTDSTSKGKPDTELVDFSSRFNTVEEILEVSTKPIIFDGDTGGKTEHFEYRVRTLERLGVSAIIIEDKVGNKRNSLFGVDVEQRQEQIDKFCEKLKLGKMCQVKADFMIIARVESLILKKGINDALKRAESYINAGADGIMIHSKEKDGKEIEEFCNYYKKLNTLKPLVSVPSAYNHLSEKELSDMGFSIIIHANHLIRSAYPAMVNTAESILEHGRSLEASNDYCMPIKDIINLIPVKD